MSMDKYIADNQMEEIRYKYGNKIVLFSKAQRTIKQWYKAFVLQYPPSSINNYRDSWFHYRKIWTERSYYEVTCQTANFDEHIQRAEKDAIVNFFQIMTEHIEFWYHVNKIEIPADMIDYITKDVEKIYKKSEILDKQGKFWIVELFNYYKSEREAVFSVIYAAQQYVLNSKEILRQLQLLLHNIKNITLNIRLGASDIDRIEYPGKYVDDCKKYYQELYDYFYTNDNGDLLTLLCITSVVKANWDCYIDEKNAEVKE